jgi:hypothetical protein
VAGFACFLAVFDTKIKSQLVSNLELAEINTDMAYCVSFGVLTAVTINMTVLWDVTPCSLVDTDTLSPSLR